MKDYHLSDVLSITTGQLLSTRHIDGIYDILNYITGETTYTHEIPDKIRQCQPYLIEQFPQLKEVNANNINKDNINIWLQEQINIFGEYLSIKPLNNI